MHKVTLLGLLLLHLLIPSVCVLLFEASPFWLVGNFLFCFALAGSIRGGIRKTRPLLLSVISFLWAVLTFLLGISYYIQGTGFNDQFFYHLDLNTLSIAVHAFGGLFLPASLYIVIATAAPFILSGFSTPSHVGRIPVAILWFLSVVTNYPIWSYIDYRIESGEEYPPYERVSETGSQSVNPATELSLRFEAEGTSLAEGTQAVSDSKTLDSLATTKVDSVSLEDGNRSDDLSITSDSIDNSMSERPEKKSIILIYAEGIEQLFFQREIFGEILPELRELSDQAKMFSNVHQVKGTGWTMGGIVASQCGFPVLVSNHLASNSSMASVQNPYADQQCLADILTDSDFTTVYMGGASLEFAGKGNFLRTHGYQEILGKEDLLERLGDKDYVKGFGLFDDSLFDFAVEKLDELESEQNPYLLTILTLDSHHPYGRPSKSCNVLSDNKDSMSNAIYCSDQLIAKFVRDAMKKVDRDKTIIVLMSDHLSMRNTLSKKIKQHEDQRRLTFMLFDMDAPGKIDKKLTHFDIAPTILDAARIDGFSTLAMGASAFSSNTSPELALPTDLPVVVSPPLLKSIDSASIEGVKISRHDLKITIGDLEVVASANGTPFEFGMFVLVLDDQGHVVDTIYSDDGELLLKSMMGRLVIGISVFRDGDMSNDQYFYGRFSEDPGKMVFRPFGSDVSINPQNIASVLGR
jgi:hypothetical protein